MTEPIPLDALYDLTTIPEIALSPDGERVAFVADERSRADDETHSSVSVVPTDRSRTSHRLTRVSDAGSPKWSPDGLRLGFLAARERDVALAVEEGEDEEDVNGEDDASEPNDNEPKPQLWVFDLELGGDARQVTDQDEGVREFDWGPDGERIVVSARDPTDEEREYLNARRDGDAPIETERLQHKFNGHGWLDTVTTYLFVIDIDTRETRRLDDSYGSGAFEAMAGLQPAWSPDGDRIAFVSNRTDRPDDSAVMDLYTIEADGTNLSRLTETDLTVGSPEWDSDGKRLAFTGDNPENWCVPTQVYCWENGEYETLTADLDRTVSRGASLRWDGESVVTTVGDESHVRFVRAHTDGSSAERVFDRQNDYRTFRAFDLQGNTLAALVTHPSEGADLYAMAAEELDAGGESTSSSISSDEANPFRRLTGVNDDLIDAHEMPHCERVAYESEEHEIDAIAYLPPGFDRDDPEPHPLVVSIHGGPIGYDMPEFNFEYAVWTSRGYIVLCPNYRGGASYGQAFAEALYGEWGTVEVTDIVAGVESLVERGWGDPDRVFGRGLSYGGIAQGYLVTQTDVFTAAAPEHGIYDLRSAFGTDDSQVMTTAEFGLPWENPAQFDASSAVTDAGNIDTPLLVMAGGQDWRCPPTQSEQLYVSARKQGVEAKLVVYPDEHHNIGDPDRAIHRLEELTGWFEKHDPTVKRSALDDDRASDSVTS
jgi:dipeptidyl aminopeptidase/acylaminoacyl peptidase